MCTHVQYAVVQYLSKSVLNYSPLLIKNEIWCLSFLTAE